MQNKDSIKNTLFIGLGLCLVCAAVISFIAVGLKQLQKQNIIIDQQKKIVAAANLESFYGSVYVGVFKNGKRNGDGTLTQPEEKMESGRWENSKLVT